MPGICSRPRVPATVHARLIVSVWMLPCALASIAAFGGSALQVSTGVDAPLAEALSLATESPADPPGAFRGTGSWLDSVAGLLPQHSASRPAP